MKKYLIIIFLWLLLVGIFAIDGMAHSKKTNNPDNYLSFSFFITPLSVGLKHQLSKSIFLTGNMDYIGHDQNLIFQGGLAYMIPRKIWIFRFYGGGGIEYSRNDYQTAPYVMVGTKLWIVHFDIVHLLWRGTTPAYRLGFMFSF